MIGYSEALSHGNLSNSQLLFPDFENASDIKILHRNTTHTDDCEIADGCLVVIAQW